MKIHNTKENWGAASKFFHWAVALLILTMVPLGYWSTNTMAPLMANPQAATPEQWAFAVKLFVFHKSIGLIIFILAAIRMIWRFVSPRPLLVLTLKGYERTFAHITHWSLYAVLLLMPVVGYIANSAGGFTFNFLWLGVVPNIIPENEQLMVNAMRIHDAMAVALIVLIVIHISAALRHHFILKDRTLSRMLPGHSGNN